MEGRELFFKVCRGERPEEIPFVPDITDWYLGQHRNPGEPLKYGPGVYIPDDDEIKYERGIGIPEEFYGLSLKEIHEKYNMAMHVHIRDWYEEYYSDDVKYSEVVEQSHKRITYTTKKGVLRRDFKLAADGSWCSVNYLMDGPEDFPILFEILKATRFRLREGAVDSVIRALGTRGQGDLVVNRSPFGKLLHEYLGFEKIT